MDVVGHIQCMVNPFPLCNHQCDAFGQVEVLAVLDGSAWAVDVLVDCLPSLRGEQRTAYSSQNEVHTRENILPFYASSCSCVVPPRKSLSQQKNLDDSCEKIVAG